MPPAPLPRPSSEPGGWSRSWPAWGLAGLVVLLLGARLAEGWELPLPLCWFKLVTGLPCAFCGGTRAVLAAAHLDLTTAVRLNPLVCLLGAAVVVTAVLWAADPWLGTRWRDRLRRCSDWPWLWIAMGLLAANWVYLLAVALAR